MNTVACSGVEGVTYLPPWSSLVSHIKTALLTAALSFGLMVSAHAQTSATDFVRSKSDEIVRVVNTAPDRDARIVGLRQAVRTTLDFRLLAERTLSRHWAGLSPADQTRFVDALQKLIETSYSSKLGNETLAPGSYTVNFTDEKERRGRYTVSATVTARGETHNVDVRLQQSSAGAWQVYDVITDDISLQESYAESFDEIIRSKGFPELMRRLEQRTAEMEASAKKK